MEDTPAPSPAARAALAEADAAMVSFRAAYDGLLDALTGLCEVGAVGETGHRSMGTLLEELLRVGPNEASTLLRDARMVRGRPELLGGVVDPPMPATAQALADGAIRPGHLAVIAETMGRLRRLPHLPSGVVAETERQLVELARQRSSTQLRRDADAVLLLLDPDGQLAPDADRPVQELELSTGRDGSLRGRFRFADPSAAQAVRTAIDALTPPPDPEPDTTAYRPGRTLAERRAHALHDMAADTHGLPDDDHDGFDDLLGDGLFDDEAGNADDPPDDDPLHDGDLDDEDFDEDAGADAANAGAGAGAGEDEGLAGDGPAWGPDPDRFLGLGEIDGLDEELRRLIESFDDGPPEADDHDDPVDAGWPGSAFGEPSGWSLVPPPSRRRRPDRSGMQSGRSDAQRRRRGRRGPKTQGGDAVQVTVGVPLSLLRRGLGLDHAPSGALGGLGCSRCTGADRWSEPGEVPFGLLDGQWPITAEAARLACDAQIIPVVLGGRGEVLDLGRASRTVTRAQRRALIQRDRHCAHPGCRRPPKRCAAHHVEPWSWGGGTGLDNLVLLCAHHHHLIHHSGWSIRMVDGLPQFIPPRWLDPHQRPRTNRTTQPAG